MNKRGKLWVNKTAPKAPKGCSPIRPQAGAGGAGHDSHRVTVALGLTTPQCHRCTRSDAQNGPGTRYTVTSVSQALSPEKQNAPGGRIPEAFLDCERKHQPGKLDVRVLASNCSEPRHDLHTAMHVRQHRDEFTTSPPVAPPGCRSAGARHYSGIPPQCHREARAWTG